MKIVVFGLSVSSSWGNGHATLWRALIRALDGLGHHVVFFERDTPYYASHRDLPELPWGELILYDDWNDARRLAHTHLADADAGIVTSYCPDAIPASEALLNSNAAVRCFYDLDTGVTLERVRTGKKVDYIPARGLSDFDLVLSYTGGYSLAELKSRLGARHVAPLYGCVDPDTHRPAPAQDHFRSTVSYLGTWSVDRQSAFDDLFLEPARRRDDLSFLIGGSQYPVSLELPSNVRLIPHVPPGDHPAFYCSSDITLNLTRRAMAEMGYCPSGRLFEAAACGVPILTDEWEGLDYFFEAGREVLVARTTGHVMDALAKDPTQLARIARAGRERALGMHTGTRRALELENVLEAAVSLPVESKPGYAD